MTRDQKAAVDMLLRRLEELRSRLAAAPQTAEQLADAAIARDNGTTGQKFARMTGYLEAEAKHVARQIEGVLEIARRAFPKHTKEAA